MNSLRDRERTPAPPRASTRGCAAPATRDAYADAGMALRYSRSLLEAAEPSSFERRVWEAVAIDLLGSWSRLSEARPSLTRDVCRLVGRDPDSARNRSRVGVALAALRDAGALGYRPASGTDSAVVTLPEPPDEWADPTTYSAALGRCRTAGEIREARRQAREERPDDARGGVSHPQGEGGSPTTWETRDEESYEEPPPDPPTGPRTPSEPTREEVDSELHDLAARLGLTLTRTADDLHTAYRARRADGWTVDDLARAPEIRDLPAPDHPAAALRFRLGTLAGREPPRLARERRQDEGERLAAEVHRRVTDADELDRLAAEARWNLTQRGDATPDQGALAGEILRLLDEEAAS